METSKKLLYLSYGILIILIALVIFCTFAEIECGNLTTVASLVAVEVGASTSFYYSMNKKLNLPKVIKHIYDEAPDELREQLDINQILSNISD
jgi:ABC-type enterobactin transport system permease subunit